MKLPELHIEMDIDVEYNFYLSDQDIVASARSHRKKPPYSVFSTIRDHIRSIFDDTSKYTVLSYKPSTENYADYVKLKDVLELRYSTNPEDRALYRSKIDEYLKDKPESTSFYILSEIKSSSGIVICNVILDICIADHRTAPKTTEQIANTKLRHADKFRAGDMDFDLVPIGFVVNTDASVNYGEDFTNLLVSIIGDYPTSFYGESVDEINTKISKYLNHIWKVCNDNIKFDPSVVESSVKTISSEYHSIESAYDLQQVLIDLEHKIKYMQDKKLSVGDDKFYGYSWDCTHLNVSEDDYGEYISEICVRDNFRNYIRLYCEIDVEQYFQDTSYREDILKDLCIDLFEWYYQF